MSDKNLARRTAISVYFGGLDITKDMQKYLISLTYTDNEEDEADDLQIKLQDRDGIWREKWLNTAIHAAVERSLESDQAQSAKTTTQYRVISTGGAAVHNRANEKYARLGTLAYGTIISVASFADGWANFTYSKRNAYVKASCLKAVVTVTDSQASAGSWSIGDSVTVTGTPQYSSSGVGKPGKAVTNYKGTITRLNLKNGVKYPIHVGALGWFAESEVQKTGASGESETSAGKTEKGLLIQAAILRQNWRGDGKDELLECGQFELDTINAQGPPNTVSLKATALPFCSSIRQTEKSKSWENYTLSGIANEMADKNGMACMFESGVNPSYKRIEQYKNSDIAFLKKLCQDAGCSLKITNNIIVIFNQSKYAEKPAIRTICYGKDYISYKLSTSESGTYTSCRVSYTGNDGKVISGTAYITGYKKDDKKNQCLEIKQKVSSVAEAQTLAAQTLRLHNKFEFSATFTVPGDPSLLAGCNIMLSGFGAWDGKYAVKQARHKVDNAGYTTQISLRRIV